MASDTRRTLLVGSVNLESAEAVFLMAATLLGDSLIALPDGETGDRKAWIGWQASILNDAPFLERSGGRSGDAYGGTVREFVRYKAVGDLTNARFERLGYADVAIESYKLFKSLRERGDIPPHIRFQVSLPTPLAPLAAAIEPQDFFAVEKIYEEAMRREVMQICAEIPAQDLAVQWDVSIEIAILEGVAMQDGIHIFSDLHEDLSKRIAKVIGWIPSDVAVGFHLCYGDYDHKHFVEPKDMGLMVELANEVFAFADRAIDWVHMPVPIKRDDDAYFAPLRALQKPPSTRVFLGLVHRADGLEGGKGRMAVAKRYLPDFGVSTECGMGRRPPETISGVMGLMAEMAAI